MADLFIPDVSEYQSVDFTVFTGPIIVRAHNSNREDNHWTRHADGAARQAWWGAYQYLTRNADAATAAHRMLDTIGARKPNVVIVDIEEGDGSQARRRVEWFDVIRSAGFCPWAYSGEAFARAHGLGDVDWIAAYRKTEPAAPHLLWQFADNHWFPGIGNCDGSIFHGTVNELIALTSGTPTPPTRPRRRKMIHLIRSKGTKPVYATDLVTKRWVHDETQLAHLKPVITADGGIGEVQEWDPADVDAIPTVGPEPK